MGNCPWVATDSIARQCTMCTSKTNIKNHEVASPAVPQIPCLRGARCAFEAQAVMKRSLLLYRSALLSAAKVSADPAVLEKVMKQGKCFT